MTYTIILLAIIAILELIKLILVYRKPTVKSYLNKVLEGLDKEVWNADVATYKWRIQREDVRGQYDQVKAGLTSLEEKLKDYKGKPEDKGKLEDEIVRAEADVKKLETTLSTIDIVLTGAKPSAELPEGRQGLNELKESKQDMIAITKKYIKTL